MAAQPSKRSNEGAEAAPAVTLARLAEQTQLDFELDFFAGILERHAGYVDVLRAHGNNLTLKGRYADGLEVDKKLIQLRPNDALAHYNLACSYALLKKPDLALKTCAAPSSWATATSATCARTATWSPSATTHASASCSASTKTGDGG